MSPFIFDNTEIANIDTIVSDPWRYVYVLEGGARSPTLRNARG